MSEVSGGRRIYERVQYSVPLNGGEGDAIRNLYDVLRNLERDAEELGINTGYDDWACYTNDEHGLTVWFEVPGSARWNNG